MTNPQNPVVVVDNQPFSASIPSKSPKFPKTLIKINCQMNPKINPPIKFGIKKMVLRKLFDLILRVTSKARPNPNTFNKMIATTANLVVNQIDSLNSVSLNSVI